MEAAHRKQQKRMSDQRLTARKQLAANTSHELKGDEQQIAASLRAPNNELKAESSRQKMMLSSVQGVTSSLLKALSSER